MLFRLFLLFIVTSSTIPGTIQGADLTVQDIPKVMKGIFSEHVIHKKMDEEVMRRSILIFIDQFDPDRCYFLASEVSSFLNLSSAKVTSLIQDYEKNNYSFFYRLQSECCRAILRSRDLRKKDSFTSLQTVEAEAEKSDQDILLTLKAPFPQTIEDLEKRIRVRMVRLIQKRAEKEKAVPFADIVKQVEADIQEFENSYLGVGKDGKPLSAKEKEDLFVFHLLKALFASLDAHSSFMEASEAKVLKMKLQGSFDGIGVVLEEKNGAIRVSKLIAGGAADTGKLIEPGDEVILVDGVSTEKKSVEDVVASMQGSAGTTISLRLKRSDKILNVTLTRTKIKLEEGKVETKFEPFDGGIIGEITLHAFYEGRGESAAEDVKKAILDLKKKGPLKGLILDLRDNRGGFLMQAVKIAGLFMKTGVVVISKSQDGTERFYRDTDPSDLYDGPLIILTSKMTASAAEIVTVALKDYGLAVVVGDTRTYGKGSIQSQTVTSGRQDPALKVTVGQYYPPSGHSIQLEGVKADIVVPSVFFDSKVGEEYLDFPIEESSVPPAFQDTLQDIPTKEKGWYVHYYLPHLQKRQTISEKTLDFLRKQSQKRLLLNEEYQRYLSAPTHPVKMDKADETDEQQRIWDLQNEEAFNILKDLIKQQK